MDHLAEPRGKPLRGARKIAAYVFDDPEEYRAVYELDREEYGLIELAGQ
jgi:hypothetical protein